MIEIPWFVMLTEPQQDITTVWRLHELGLELFVPVLRRRVNTGRTGRKGHKITRTIAKPMFPGYGFLRAFAVDHRRIEDVRGVRGFLRDENNRPTLLPHQAVMAVFQRQIQEQKDWLDTHKFKSRWKRGDTVRIDHDGGAYAGLIATVDRIDGHGRIEVLFGMIRHSIPQDVVIAA